MKILIAGAGKVGSTLARQLAAEGHDITLIDQSAAVLNACVERYDVLGAQGNCASLKVLEKAGAATANLLIAVAGADEVNLLCCTSAHSLNPALHTIARIRNPEYSGQIYSMKDVFALSMAVNPERQAALEIERLLRYPGFLKRDTFAKGRVEIVELRVDDKSRLREVPLSRLNEIVKCRVLVCTVLREGKAVTPGGDFVLREGDRVFVTASTNDLTTLLRNLGLITQKAKRAMLIGGGRVSYYLAQRLQRDGMTVQLIEQDRARCEMLASMLPEGVSIICGDGSDQDLLESEGVAECDALVTLTGLDEMNMLISLYGHSLGIPRVVTKVGRTGSGTLRNSLELGSVVCPKDLCCNDIVRYVRAMQNQSGAALSMHTIADEQAEAIEFAVDETTLHCGEPLKDIRLKPGVLVASISHGEKTEIPSGESQFRRGDTLVLVCDSGRSIHQLNDIFTE